MLENNKIKSRKKAVKWNLMLQYLLLGINLIKGFLIVPFYFLFIDSTLFGYWLATGSILVWINIIDPGAGTVLQQKIGYQLGNRNRDALKKLIGSGILIGVIICIIALIVSYIFSSFIPTLLGFVNFQQEKVLVNAFRIASIGTCFSLITSVVMGIHRGMQNTKIPGIIEIVASLLGIIVNIILLYNGFGLFSIAAMLLVIGTLTCMGNLVYLKFVTNKQNIKIQYSLSSTFPLFKEFSYTFFSRLLNLLTHNFDLIIISRFIGAEMVIIIEMTRRPLKIIEGMVYKPAVALAPAMANLHGEGDLKKLNTLLSQFFYILIWSYCFLISGFLLFNGDLITLWLGTEKFAGIFIGLLIYSGILFKGFFSSIGNLNFALGDIKGSSIIIIVQNILYFLLVIILGKYFGLIGIIGALIPSVLFTSAWYHFKRLHRAGILSTQNIYIIIKNISLAVFVGFLAFQIQNILTIVNWYQLIIGALIYATLFIILLCVISKTFRTFLLSKIKDLKIIKVK